MASHWLAQLASLLFVLIRLLIATKMASESILRLILKWAIKYKLMQKKREILEKISTTPGHLT